MENPHLTVSEHDSQQLVHGESRAPERIASEAPQSLLEKHKTARHFLVEFFVVLFSNLTNFFRDKDREIEEKEHITDSVIKK